MLHQISSLEQIKAGVDAPHPDAVVLALRMRDFPEAFVLLIEREADDNCWRTINLPQVRVAATLSSLLMEAESRMEGVVQGIVQMEEAEAKLEEVGGRLLRISGIAASLGFRAVQLTLSEAMGRLDDAHTAISQVMLKDLRQAKSAMAHRWTSPGEDELIEALDEILTTLRDCNRRVVRRIQGLHRMVRHLNRFKRPPKGRHWNAISNQDEELEQVAIDLSPSIDQLVRSLFRGPTDPDNADDDPDNADADPVVQVRFCQRLFTDRLNSLFHLNHPRFSSTVHVKSLIDLNVVADISVPHQGQVGFPYHRLEVQLLGLTSLSEANVVREIVDQGIAHNGWMVRCLPALQIAQLLDDLLHTSLRNAIIRVLNTDVLLPDGRIMKTEPFNALRDQGTAISQLMGHGLLNFPEGYYILEEVNRAVLLSSKPLGRQRQKRQLHGMLFQLRANVDRTRASMVDFRENPIVP